MSLEEKLATFSFFNVLNNSEFTNNFLNVLEDITIDKTEEEIPVYSGPVSKYLKDLYDDCVDIDTTFKNNIIDDENIILKSFPIKYEILYIILILIVIIIFFLIIYKVLKKKYAYTT